MPERIMSFTVETSGERLDVFVCRVSGMSRAQIQKGISGGRVRVNGENKKANYKLSAGEAVELELLEPSELLTLPENIPLDIVYQDDYIAVINKPQGMVVHPAPGNEGGTLVNALLYAMDDLSGIGGVKRPGIVHRIDKMTSGLIVIAKNDTAHASLSAQIKAHTAKRSYILIVEGNIKEDAGTVDAPIGRHPTDRKKMTVLYENSRQAVTHWRVMSRAGIYTLVEAELETGRTHQIRVHMKHIKHPVAGDPIYGSATKHTLGLTGQALHAFRLELNHPHTLERMSFIAKAPEQFLSAVKKAGLDTRHPSLDSV